MERALSVLSEAVQLAGTHFMSGRFRQQALPLLLQLLRRGTAAAGSGGGEGASTSSLVSFAGGGEQQPQRDLAPAALQRIRIATLECLSSATAKAKSASRADSGGGMPGLAWDIASAALPFLGRSQTPPLRDKPRP